MVLKIATAPTVEPVSLIEAKEHLRVTHDSDDNYIIDLIKAARRQVESTCRRALITQTWDYYLDAWPDSNSIELPLPVLQSITHIKYTNSSSTQTTFTSYTADIVAEPGKAVLTYGSSWPSFTPTPVNPIVIRFVTGYGAAATAVPEPIRQAMKLLISHMYDNREPVLVSRYNTSMPLSVDYLLADYRIAVF